MNDDLHDKIIAKAIDISDQIEKDIITRNGGPVGYLLLMARADAIGAMRALTDADPFDPKQIMALQNEVQRFRSLIGWLRAALDKGTEAFKSLTEQERIEVLQLLNQENDA